jgi:hypothetical protein
MPRSRQYSVTSRRARNVGSGIISPDQKLAESFKVRVLTSIVDLFSAKGTGLELPPIDIDRIFLEMQNRISEEGRERRIRMIHRKLRGKPASKAVYERTFAHLVAIELGDSDSESDSSPCSSASARSSSLTTPPTTQTSPDGIKIASIERLRERRCHCTSQTFALSELAVVVSSVFSRLTDEHEKKDLVSNHRAISWLIDVCIFSVFFQLPYSLS